MVFNGISKRCWDSSYWNIIPSIQIWSNWNTFRMTFLVVSTSASGERMTAHCRSHLFWEKVSSEMRYQHETCVNNVWQHQPPQLCQQQQTKEEGEDSQTECRTSQNQKAFFVMLRKCWLVLGLVNSRRSLLISGRSLSKVWCKRGKSYRWSWKLETRKTCGDSMPKSFSPVSKKEYTVWQLDVNDKIF